MPQSSKVLRRAGSIRNAVHFMRLQSQFSVNLYAVRVSGKIK